MMILGKALHGAYLFFMDTFSPVISGLFLDLVVILCLMAFLCVMLYTIYEGIFVVKDIMKRFRKTKIKR